MDIATLLEKERDAILARCDRLAEVSGLKLSTLSGHILNDGKGLKRLRGGGGLHPTSLPKVKAKIAELERKHGVLGVEQGAHNET